MGGRRGGEQKSMVRYCSGCGTQYTVDATAPALQRFCAACGEELLPPAASAEIALADTVITTFEPVPHDESAAALTQPGGYAPIIAATPLTPPTVVKSADQRWLYAASAALAAPPPAPPIAAVASLAAEPPAPRSRRFAWLDQSAGFLVSTIVHTIAFVVLSLLVVAPPVKTQVLSLVTTRPAHQAEEELLVEEFQAIEVEATVESVSQMSEEEMLATATEVDLSEMANEPGLGELADAGQFTLPEGLLAARAGGGPGGSDLGSATFTTRLRREKAKSGDVQISLLWNNYNDIDLHVRCPSGELISFDHRNSRCRGELDVDMNAKGRESDEPIENIYWPAGKAPYGDYYVVVHHYRNHGDEDPTMFEVQVKVDGRVRKFQGELSHGDDPMLIYRFTRARGSNADDFYVE